MGNYHDPFLLSNGGGSNLMVGSHPSLGVPATSGNVGTVFMPSLSKRDLNKVCDDYWLSQARRSLTGVRLSHLPKVPLTQYSLQRGGSRLIWLT